MARHGGRFKRKLIVESICYMHTLIFLIIIIIFFFCTHLHGCHWNPKYRKWPLGSKSFGEYEQFQPIGKDSDFSREIYDFYANGED